METFYKHWHRFCQADPFNLQNKVIGLFNSIDGDYNGAVYIISINDQLPPEQLFYFPVKSKDYKQLDIAGAKEVKFYRKIEGIDVFQFFYLDHTGSNFESFRVKSEPFMPMEFVDKLIKYDNMIDMTKKEAESFLKLIEKEHGWTLEENKEEVMRELAKHFGNKNMTFIYKVLTGEA